MIYLSILLCCFAGYFFFMGQVTEGLLCLILDVGWEILYLLKREL